MKKQSFLKGALILTVATGLGKVFSAIFKIPLDRLFLHAEGMAVFNTAYNMYMFFFAVATAGIPLAVSRLIARAESKNDEDEIVSTALIFTSAFLTLSSVIIFTFSDRISAMALIPDAALSFRVMAPALIFCSFTATLRGYFQGKQNMGPSALSQVFDSFGRLFLGFLLAYIFSQNALFIASAGAIAGVPFGAFLSAAVLLIAFFKSGNRIKKTFSFPILKAILLSAIPLTITMSLHPIFNMIDSMTVVSTLKHFGFNFPQTAFGTLGRAAMLYALPVSLASGIAASVLPAVSESDKNGDSDLVVANCSLSIRLSLMLSVPCAAGFIAISEKLIFFLFDNTTNHLTLAFIAPSAIFLSLGSVLVCILQALGKTKYTVYSSLLAIASKPVFNFLLMKHMGVNGAALATTLSYALFSILLLIFAFYKAKITVHSTDLIIKPFICGFLCLITAFYASSFAGTVLSILLAALVYIPSVFITRLVTLREVSQIFEGR